MATVVSVNISERKGEQKHPVSEIQLKLRHGIVGDAHAGDWHRQISLLAEESVDTMRSGCPIPLDGHPGIHPLILQMRRGFKRRIQALFQQLLILLPCGTAAEQTDRQHSGKYSFQIQHPVLSYSLG